MLKFIYIFYKIMYNNSWLGGSFMVIEGLSVDKIKTISKLKQETEDVLDFRLKSYEKFKNMPLPSFGPSLDIDFDKIIYYASNDNKINSSWESIDKNITN